MIKIFKNKIQYTNFEGKKSNIHENTIMFYLGEYVELDKNVTFERIMKIFMKERNMINIVFGKTLGRYRFEPFYNDMMKRNPKYKCNPKKDYLEVYMYPDIWKFEKNKPIEFGLCYDIHMLKTGDKENTPYGLSFLELNNIRDLKIKIKDSMDFYLNDTTVESKEIKEINKCILQTKLNGFRLFDFIYAILYEISWYGSPEDRDKQSDKLTKKIKAIDEGKAKLVKFSSFEEMLKTLKKKKSTKKKA